MSDSDRIPSVPVPELGRKFYYLAPLGLDHVQVFETACGIKDKHLVVGFNPTIGHQTAQRGDAGRAFGAKENTLRFSNSRYFRQHFIVPDA